MVQVGMLETDADSRQKRDGKGYILAVLMALIASGLLPVFSSYFRPSTWIIWVTLFFIIILFSRDLPLAFLLKPIIPYYIWLLCFIVWGLIVSPVPAFGIGLKVVVATFVIAMAMAIITSKILYLKIFSNAMQYIAFGNVLLFLIMMYSPKVGHILEKAVMSRPDFEPGISRFPGFWGNPNMAGYMCLIIIVLSVWATPLIAWLGRFSSLSIIYLSASRKSMLLLLLLIVLNIVIVQRHDLKKIFTWAMMAFMLASVFLLSDSVMRKARTRVASDSNIARLLDVTESRTVQMGGETRVDLLQEWLQVASREPWYGYGFGAMAGRLDSKGRVINYRLPIAGSHNTYVGVYIEAGAIGAITFLLVLFYYARTYLLFRGANMIRWALLALLACNIVILFVSHNHLFSSEGEVVYALFFLLPTCPSLRRWALAS